MIVALQAIAIFAIAIAITLAIGFFKSPDSQTGQQLGAFEVIGPQIRVWQLADKYTPTRCINNAGVFNSWRVIANGNGTCSLTDTVSGERMTVKNDSLLIPIVHNSHKYDCRPIKGKDIGVGFFIG